MFGDKSIQKMVFSVLALCTIISLFTFGCGGAAPQSSAGTMKLCYNFDSTALGYPPEIMTRPQNNLPTCMAVETLLRLDGTGAIVPWLATDWKADPTAQTITLTLRKGVKFHDGTDFNAEAARWNLQLEVDAKRTELNVKSIDVVDDYTVRMTLNTWDVDVVSRLAQYYSPIVSPTAYQKNGGKDWAIKNIVGTGPFTFVSWTKDAKQIYTKNPNYWQKGKPYVEGVEYYIIVDPMVQMASLKAKEVDVIYSLSPLYANQLKDQGFNVQGLAGWGNLVTMLFPPSGQADSPFANVKVRQAMSYALDSKAMATSLFYGYADVTNQWSAPGVLEYSTDVKGYPYDPNKAKQLLKEAGYPNGIKTSIVCPNDADTVQRATAMQGYLNAVGIQTELAATTQQKWAEMGQITGWSNALFFRSLKAFDTLTQFTRYYHSKKTSYAAVLKSITHSDALDQLIDKALQAPDSKTKMDLVHQIQKMTVDEMAMTSPMYVDRRRLAAWPYVKNMGFGQNCVSPDTCTPEDFWLDNSKK
jgi:peptide/nickel transport system substrate-binding protein